MTDATHYDPEAETKLNIAFESFDDLEFAVVYRIVSLEEAPVGELPSALYRTLTSPIRNPSNGTDDVGGNQRGPSEGSSSK
jgi:hypothetical protein